MDATSRAILEYQEAARRLATHQEATQMAEKAVLQAKETLAGLAPGHPLLEMNAKAIAETLRSVKLNPMQMMVEVLLRREPPQQSLSGAAPDTALLAASVAASQVGQNTATLQQILERVSLITRDRQMQR